MACIPITFQPSMKIKQIPNYIYLHDLQMYILPPSGYIKLEELYQWCIDRLKVLELVNKISKQYYKARQCRIALIKELEKNDLTKFAKLINMSNYEISQSKKELLRKNDSISHFILRSAFSLEHKKRQWFFKQEVKLFKWRLSFLNKKDIKLFNYINGIQFPSVSEQENQKIKKDLEMFCFDNENINIINFYKVYFTNVINLVAKRQVFLKNGIAYVPETKVYWIIFSEFKKKLNEGFAYSRTTVSNIYGDERITKIFNILQNYINKPYLEYNRYKYISINELDELSQKSFPLCMRLLHEALQKNHHLTNGGRVQYGLFLKGIGLKLHDAIQFWKEEFTKKMDERTFEKQYKYGIRFLYGQEGKRADYEPFHCFKIFNSNVGLRDNHGCPFKCMTFDLLKQTLSNYGLIHLDILYKKHRK